METGTEDFFKSKAMGKLGKGRQSQAHSVPLLRLAPLVPIIAVFTKYDKVVTTGRVAMTKAGQKPTAEEAMAKAAIKLQKECIVPFEGAVGMTIPHVAVSGILIDNVWFIHFYLLTYHLVRSQYTNTLSELVKVTADNVEKYIAEAAIVTGISQRINAQVKIHASIE